MSFLKAKHIPPQHLTMMTAGCLRKNFLQNYQFSWEEKELFRLLLGERNLDATCSIYVMFICHLCLPIKQLRAHDVIEFYAGFKEETRFISNKFSVYTSWRECDILVVL